jgi:hypothetical protein
VVYFIGDGGGGPRKQRHLGEFQRLSVYHTRDTYTIRLAQPLLRNSIETLCKALEDHDLIADYFHCVNALREHSFAFIARSTHKAYKRFLGVTYEVLGPFSASISFDEDYPPPGCAYNTTINVEVDSDGEYLLSLLNVLSFSKESEVSEECRRRRLQPAAPFGANCTEAGNVASWLGREVSRGSARGGLS